MNPFEYLKREIMQMTCTCESIVIVRLEKCKCKATTSVLDDIYCPNATPTVCPTSLTFPYISIF